MPHQDAGYCLRHFKEVSKITDSTRHCIPAWWLGFNDSFFLGSFVQRATYRTIPKNLILKPDS